MKKVTLDKSKFIKRDFFKFDKNQVKTSNRETKSTDEYWTIPDGFECDDGYAELVKTKTRV